MSLRSISLGVFAFVVVLGLTAAASSSPIAASSPNGVTTCNSPSPCIEGSNYGAGPGVEGVANNFSVTAFRAGVEGLDATNGSNELNNVGAYGLSHFGAGVAGQSRFGFGVFATDNAFLIPAENRVRGDVLNFQCIGAFQGRPCAALAAEDEEGRTRSAAGVFDSVNGLGVAGMTSHKSASDNVGLPGVLGLDISLDNVSEDRGVEGDSRMSWGVIGFTFNMSDRSGVSRSGVLGINDSIDSGHLNTGVTAYSYDTGVLAVSFASMVPSGSTQHPAVEAVCAGGACIHRKQRHVVSWRRRRVAGLQRQSHP